MTTKTLTWVADDLSPYESNGKTIYYINIAFDDESTASLGKQDQAKASELQAMLVALKGQPSEFGLEDKGKPNKKGQPSYKIKSFPGYDPAPYQGEGGGGGGKSWYNSAEGVAFTQERTDRRTALMQAVTATSDGTGRDPFLMATMFYNWLRETAVAPPAPPGRGDAAAGTVVIPAPTVPANREQAPAEKEGGEGVGEGAFAPEGSAGACSHDQVTFFKPPPNEDVRLPAGKVRCVACGKIVKEQGP